MVLLIHQKLYNSASSKNMIWKRKCLKNVVHSITVKYISNLLILMYINKDIRYVSLIGI